MNLSTTAQLFLSQSQPGLRWAPGDAPSDAHLAAGAIGVTEVEFAVSWACRAHVPLAALTTMAALPHGATPRPGDLGCNELSVGKEPSWGCQGSSALQLRCVPGGAADLPQDI